MIDYDDVVSRLGKESIFSRLERLAKFTRYKTHGRKLRGLETFDSTLCIKRQKGSKVKIINGSWQHTIRR